MKKYIVFISLLMVILFTACFFTNYYNSIFSPTKWNSNIWGRYKMLDDLTEKHTLYGMTYTDIIVLLGNNGIVEASHKENSFLQYYIQKTVLGPSLFTFIFDDKGRVVEYSVIID